MKQLAQWRKLHYIDVCGWTYEVRIYGRQGDLHALYLARYYLLA